MRRASLQNIWQPELNTNTMEDTQRSMADEETVMATADKNTLVLGGRDTQRGRKKQVNTFYACILYTNLLVKVSRLDQRYG